MLDAAWQELGQFTHGKPFSPAVIMSGHSLSAGPSIVLFPSYSRGTIPFPREWVLVHDLQRRDSLAGASTVLWGQLVAERRWLTRLLHILQGPTFRTCLSGRVWSSKQTPGRNVDRETKESRTRSRLDDGWTSAKQLESWVSRAQLFLRKGNCHLLIPFYFWELTWLFPPLLFFLFNYPMVKLTFSWSTFLWVLKHRDSFKK